MRNGAGQSPGDIKLVRPADVKSVKARLSMVGMSNHVLQTVKFIRMEKHVSQTVEKR